MSEFTTNKMNKQMCYKLRNKNSRKRYNVYMNLSILNFSFVLVECVSFALLKMQYNDYSEVRQQILLMFGRFS